jgi:hypothetical protein
MVKMGHNLDSVQFPPELGGVSILPEQERDALAEFFPGLFCIE